MYYFLGYLQDRICLGYVTGFNEKKTRIWQLVDDSPDEQILEKVPTLTFPSNTMYVSSAGAWTMSTVTLTKQRVEIEQSTSHASSQYFYTKTATMHHTSLPVYNVFNFRPDGTQIGRAHV